MSCFRCFDLRQQLKLTKCDLNLVERLQQLELENEWLKSQEYRSEELEREIQAKELAFQREFCEYDERIDYITDLYKKEKHGHDRAMKTIESIKTLNIALMAQIAEYKSALAEYEWIMQNVVGKNQKMQMELNQAMQDAKKEIKRKRVKSNMDRTFLKEVK